VNLGQTVFAQILDYLPRYEFQKCVSCCRGDYQQKSFSCWDQYLAMAFAQLTYRESRRDIEACLRSLSGKLYHMGFRGKVARSTLADANESRDWRIYADFAQLLIRIARPLYAHDPIGVDLDQSLYALDSTTIDLCLSLFPWATPWTPNCVYSIWALIPKLDVVGSSPISRSMFSITCARPCLAGPAVNGANRSHWRSPRSFQRTFDSAIASLVRWPSLSSESSECLVLDGLSGTNSAGPRGFRRLAAVGSGSRRSRSVPACSSLLERRREPLPPTRLLGSAAPSRSTTRM